MKRVVSYIGLRFFLFFRDFFEHWYIMSFRTVSHRMLELFEELDKAFALKINLRNLFKPLYRDRSVIGYIIGFMFRSFRVLLASIIYLIIFILSVAFYLIWLMIPPYLIYKILIVYGKQ